jgi:phage-related protein
MVSKDFCATPCKYTQMYINSLLEQYPKPLYWIGAARKDLKAMPESVQDTFGYALYLAQTGQKHDQAKPLKGFGSAGVLEVVESAESGTYRAVYTVKLGNAVYVLHCFQKKSRYGIVTPKPDMELVRERLKAALAHAKGEVK